MSRLEATLWRDDAPSAVLLLRALAEARGVTPYWHDDWLQVFQGDCRAVMAELPSDSVHCVVTSPPYWGLRDYGTASWEGGEEDCDHTPDKRGSRFATPVSSKQGSNHGSGTISQRDCKCGARRQDNQLGLEPTPEEYVANMVAVFREVRRVLRNDGTVWLNLGDTFAAGHSDWSRWKGGQTFKEERRASLKPASGLKPKDLVGIPWMVAFALQADGWYLRSDIIWSKPNPMPESVTDRPTKSHEYLFLLSKSPRYFWDADAVRETSLYGGDVKKGLGSTKDFDSDKQRTLLRGERIVPMERNLRSVWTIATQPYPGAHFATFPAKLVEPCIKAGTSERGVCPECGAPWVRVVERSNTEAQRAGGPKTTTLTPRGDGNGAGGFYPIVSTTGWRPSCAHVFRVSNDDDDFSARPRDPIPATVLDPFAGSGTTGLVAQALGRRAILIDLSTDYMAQIMRRNAQIPLPA